MLSNVRPCACTTLACAGSRSFAYPQTMDAKHKALKGSPGQSLLGGVIHSMVCGVILLMCFAVLAHRFMEWRTAALVSSVCFVLFFLIGQRMIGWRERGLLAAGLLLTGIAIVNHDDAAALIETSLQRAAFLAAFMVLLSLLRVGAGQSFSVLALGEFLTRQPPGRRYIAIHSGGHVMGVLLNFGALSLLGPLIKRGVDVTRAAEPSAAAVREERQLSALVRGFSWMIAWSPTTVTQALVPIVVVGADPMALAGMGIIVAVALFPVGWINDRIVGGRARRRLAREGVAITSATVVFPKAAAIRFGTVCLALIVLTTAVVAATGVIVIIALMLVAPLVSVGWLWCQAQGSASIGGRPFRARMAELVGVFLPRSMPEALTLATGGYCGLMLAGILDPTSTAEVLRLRELPPETLYLLAVAIVPLLSNLALPPILVATFFGSLLISLPDLALDPTLLGFCFVMGWCLNLTGSPFGASALVLGRATGIRGTTLTWKWNGLFTLASYAVIACAVFLFGA